MIYSWKQLIFLQYTPLESFSWTCFYLCANIVLCWLYFFDLYPTKVQPLPSTYKYVQNISNRCLKIFCVILFASGTCDKLNCMRSTTKYRQCKTALFQMVGRKGWCVACFSKWFLTKFCVGQEMLYFFSTKILFKNILYLFHICSSDFDAIYQSHHRRNICGGLVFRFCKLAKSLSVNRSRSTKIDHKYF